MRVKDIRTGQQREIEVSSNIYPRFHGILIMPPSDLLTGKKSDPTTSYFVLNEKKEDFEHLKKIGLLGEFEAVEVLVQAGQGIFCQQLAQIAHAYTAAIVGLDGYENWLPSTVLGKERRFNDVFGWPLDVDKHTKGKITLDISVGFNGVRYLSCFVTIPDLGWYFPNYEVICGPITSDDALNSIKSKIALTVKR